MQRAQSKASAAGRKFSSYVCDLIVRDLEGQPPNALSASVITDLAARLRGDLTGYLTAALSRSDANQPAVLAALLEGLAELLRRKPEAPLDSLVIVDGAAASELQLLAAPGSRVAEPIKEKIINAIGAPPQRLLRMVAAAAEHAAQFADTITHPSEDEAIDTERQRDEARDQRKGSSRRSSSQ